MSEKRANISGMQLIASTEAFDIYDRADGLYILHDNAEPEKLTEPMLQNLLDYGHEKREAIKLTIGVVKAEIKNLYDDLAKFEKHYEENAQQLKLLQSVFKLMDIKAEIQQIQGVKEPETVEDEDTEADNASEPEDAEEDSDTSDKDVDDAIDNLAEEVLEKIQYAAAMVAGLEERNKEEC